ncbi:MAG: hypothetical protein M1380_03490 [Chloroflexi bacterium]|nr:hypothetical protein [Chloroflexota bacterium]
MKEELNRFNPANSGICHGTCAYCDQRVGATGRSPLRECGRRTESELVVKPKAPLCVIAPEEGRDPYDAAEGRCQATRHRLQEVRDAGTPVLLITRSDRVLRDLPLLAEIARGGGATLLAAVATLDPELAAFWEPESPPPDRRLAVLRPAAEAGVAAGLLASPLVPYLMDDHSSLRRLLAAAADAGARFFLAEMMALPPGAYRERALRLLAERWPQLLGPVRGLYGDASEPPQAYLDRVTEDARRIGSTLALPHGLPRSWSPGALLAAAFADRLRS